MKKTTKTKWTIILSCSVLFLSGFVVGCGPNDEPKEGVRIPDVPPPARDAETGARKGPGQSRDFTKPPG